MSFVTVVIGIFWLWKTEHWTLSNCCHYHYLLPMSFFCVSLLNNMVVCLTLNTLGKIFSRRHIKIVFLIFPRKEDLTFHANCLHQRQFAWNVKTYFLGKIRKNISICHLLKTGFNISCKLSPMETICMKCQILFCRKNKKNYFNMSSTENFTQNA